MSADHDHGPVVTAWLGLVLAGCALSFMGVAALAPRIAADTHLPSAAVGWYAGMVWTSAMVASLLTGPLIARCGPWVVVRLCLVCCLMGLLTMASGEPMLFALAAVLIGTAQGLEAPAASQLLARHVRPRRQPLLFSLKQSGVQAGAMLASLTMPAVALVMGWRGALLIEAALLLGLVLLLRSGVRRLDDHTPTTGHMVLAASIPMASWLPRLRQAPALGRLALAAFTFGAIQVCVNSFLVTWAVSTRDMALTSAGLLAGLAQGAGMVGRPLWGWVAARRSGSAGVLRALGALMGISALALGLGGNGISDPMLALVALLLGASASGWNGVFLAEIAARSPAGEVASTTTAAMIPLYLGLILGPLSFAMLSQWFTMSAGFVMLSVGAMAGTILVPSGPASAKSRH